MSFYNVQNPTSFSIVSDVRKSTVQSGKLIRFPATQIFTGAATLTAEQLVAGNVILNASNAQLTLPSASDLITLLMGPGGFDVSSSDIFSFEAFSIGSGTLTIAVNSSGGSGSNKTISSGAQKTINLQISITVSAGTTTYNYTML
jgi:hypothetical protein